jgi:PKD repeat protein
LKIADVLLFWTMKHQHERERRAKQVAGKTESIVILILFLGSMLFPTIAPVRGTDPHDLSVILKDLSARSHLESNHTILLNMTVFNNGSLPEYNVTFQLLINDSQKVNTWIDELRPGGFYTSSYQWNPTDGYYNVTAYVPPVTDETYLANNNDTKLVDVCPDIPPQPSFTVLPSLGWLAPNIVKKIDLITFDASNSSDPDWGNITWYYWNFGDGSPTQNITANFTTHHFLLYGNATVTLTVCDTDGSSNSTSITLIISDSPTASFVIYNPPNCKPPLNQEPYYVNNTLTFDATNSSAVGPIKSYLWIFGDGNSTATANKTITHVYTSPSIYNVSLTVTDNNNLTDLETRNNIIVTVGSPIANFTVSPTPCYVNGTITFDATDSCDPDNYNVSNHGIANYSWNFGDGNSTATANKTITHVYTSPGNYSVNLTVTDYDGLSGSTNKTVTAVLEAFMGIEDASNGSTTIICDPEGTFTVNVTVTNVASMDYFEFTLKYPGGSPPPLLRGEKIGQGDFPLGSKSIDDSQGQITVKSLAHLGGANGSFTLANITFTVTNPGKCTLYLTACNLTNSTGGQINIYPLQADFFTKKPYAYFEMNETGPPPGHPVEFDASKSYDPDNMTGPGIQYYTWDFGDGNLTVVQVPTITHAYATEGSYYVNLTVTDYESEAWSYRSPTPIKVGAIHDIAVINVTLTPVCLSNLTYTISMVNITINLKNKGNILETFDVTVYGDSYAANTTTVTIPAGDQTQIILSWNVTGFLKGNYTIYANATLEYDINQSDNSAAKLITLGLPCDLDGNGRVGLSDLVILAQAYGSKPGDPRWRQVADIDGSGVVGLSDLVHLALNYGNSDP